MSLPWGWHCIMMLTYITTAYFVSIVNADVYNILIYDSSVKYRSTLHDVKSDYYKKTAEESRKRLIDAFEAGGASVDVSIQEYVLANEGLHDVIEGNETTFVGGIPTITSVNVADGESICDLTTNAYQQNQEFGIVRTPLVAAIVSAKNMKNASTIAGVNLPEKGLYPITFKKADTKSRTKRSLPYYPFPGGYLGQGQGQTLNFWPMPPYAVHQPCKNGGYTVWSDAAIGDNYVCNCPFGFYGFDCRFVACMNGGIAVTYQSPSSAQRTGYCRCPPGYHGEHCEATSCLPQPTDTFTKPATKTFAVGLTQDAESYANAQKFVQQQKQLEETNVCDGPCYGRYVLTYGYSNYKVTNTDPRSYDLLTVATSQVFYNIGDMLNAFKDFGVIPTSGLPSQQNWDTLSVMSTSLSSSFLGTFEKLYFFTSMGPVSTRGDATGKMACLNTVRQRFLAFRTPIYIFFGKGQATQLSYCNLCDPASSPNANSIYCGKNGPKNQNIPNPCTDFTAIPDLSLPGRGSNYLDSFFGKIAANYWEISTYSGGQFFYVDSSTDMSTTLYKALLNELSLDQRDSVMYTDSMMYDYDKLNQVTPGQALYTQCNIANVLPNIAVPKDVTNLNLSVYLFAATGTQIVNSHGNPLTPGAPTISTPDNQGIIQIYQLNNIQNDLKGLKIQNTNAQNTYPCSVRVLGTMLLKNTSKPEITKKRHYYIGYSQPRFYKLQNNQFVISQPLADVIDVTAPWPSYTSSQAPNQQQPYKSTYSFPVFAGVDTTNASFNAFFYTSNPKTAVPTNGFDTTPWQQYTSSGTVSKTVQGLQLRTCNYNLAPPTTALGTSPNPNAPATRFDCNVFNQITNKPKKPPIYQKQRTDAFYFKILLTATDNSKQSLGQEYLYGFCNRDNDLATMSTQAYKFNNPVPFCYNGGTYVTGSINALQGNQTPLKMRTNQNLYRCVCTKLWVGSRCQIPRCFNNGQLDVSKTSCICQKGFSGNHCEISMCSANSLLPPSGTSTLQTLSIVVLGTSTMSMDVQQIHAALNPISTTRYDNYRLTVVYQSAGSNGKIFTSVKTPDTIADLQNDLYNLITSTTGLYDVNCNLLREQPIYAGIVAHFSLPTSEQKFHIGSPTYIFADQQNKEEANSYMSDVLQANSAYRSPLMFFITDSYWASQNPTGCALGESPSSIVNMVQQSYASLSQQFDGVTQDLAYQANLTTNSKNSAGTAKNRYWQGGKLLVQDAFTALLTAPPNIGIITQQAEQSICTMSSIGPLYVPVQASHITLTTSINYKLVNVTGPVTNVVQYNVDDVNWVFEDSYGEQFRGLPDGTFIVVQPGLFSSVATNNPNPNPNLTVKPITGTAPSATITANTAADPNGNTNIYNASKTVSTTSDNQIQAITYRTTISSSFQGPLPPCGPNQKDLLCRLKQASFTGGFTITNAFPVIGPSKIVETYTVPSGKRRKRDINKWNLINTVGSCSYKVTVPETELNHPDTACKNAAKNIPNCKCGSNAVSVKFVKEDDPVTLYDNPILNTPMHMVIYVQPDDIYALYNGTSERAPWPTVAEVRVLDPASDATATGGVLYSQIVDRNSNRSMPLNGQFSAQAGYQPLSLNANVCPYNYWVQKPIKCNNLDDSLVINVLVQIPKQIWRQTQPNGKILSDCPLFGAPTYPTSIQPRSVTVTCSVDPNSPQKCLNGGYESNGNCDCTGTGYTGTNCERPVSCSNNATYNNNDNLCDCNGAASYLAAVSGPATVDAHRPDSAAVNAACGNGYCNEGTLLSIGGQKCDMNACPSPNYNPVFRPLTNSFVIAIFPARQNLFSSGNPVIQSVITSAISAGYTRFVLILANANGNNVVIDTADPNEYVSRFQNAIDTGVPTPSVPAKTADNFIDMVTLSYQYSYTQGVIWIVTDINIPTTPISTDKLTQLTNTWARQRNVLHVYRTDIKYQELYGNSIYQSLSQRTGGTFFTDSSTTHLWQAMAAFTQSAGNQEIIYNKAILSPQSTNTFNVQVDSNLQYVVITISSAFKTDNVSQEITISINNATIDLVSCTACDLYHDYNVMILNIPVNSQSLRAPAGSWIITAPQTLSGQPVLCSVYGSSSNYVSAGFTMFPWIDVPEMQPVYSYYTPNNSPLQTASKNFLIVNFKENSILEAAVQFEDFNGNGIGGDNPGKLQARVRDQRQPNFCSHNMVSNGWGCPVYAPVDLQNPSTTGFYVKITGTSQTGESVQRIFPAYCNHLAGTSACKNGQLGDIGECDCIAPVNKNDWRLGNQEYYGVDCQRTLCVNGGTPVTQPYNEPVNNPQICVCPPHFAGVHCDMCENDLMNPNDNCFGQP